MESQHDHSSENQDPKVLAALKGTSVRSKQSRNLVARALSACMPDYEENETEGKEPEKK